MKREELKAKGLTDEQIDFIMAENGKDINASKAAADKAQQDLKAEQERAKGLQAQIDSRDKDIKDLQDKAKDNEGISQQLTQLQEKYTRETQDLQKRLADQQADFAIEKAFASVPFASNLAKRAAIADFRAKGYKLNDKGEFSEAESFIANLKKEDPAAFKEEKEKDGGKDPDNQGNAGNQPGHSIGNGNAWLGISQANPANLPRFTGQMTNQGGTASGAVNGAGQVTPFGLNLNFVRKPPEPGK